MATIGFSEDSPFTKRAVKFTLGVTGLYFIFLVNSRIPYPLGASRLIYIGMSESSQNSIGKRLLSHLTGQSGNRAIKNYASSQSVRFTYYPLSFLKKIGSTNLFEIESYFLEEFMRVYGAFPICNNQSGISLESIAIDSTPPSVNWSYFS